MVKIKNLIVIFIFSALIFSCNNSKKKEYSAFENQKEANNHPGKKLMEANCYACHSPSANQDDRIGPPMIAIKKRYINNKTTKANFTKDILAWIKNPTEENAKMYGAVNRFGLMPKLPFEEETITQIADYMFDFEIDKPEWFEAHYNQERGNNNGQGMKKGLGNGQGMRMQQTKASTGDLSYGERGLKYALSTKAVLGKNLMKAIQKKGTLEALAFCNIKAYPLTDSMAVVHNATIKRVSDKPRNQNNQANKKELTYIESFKTDIKNNIEPKAIVDQLDNKVQVYYPISTNTMCLQCHGKINQDIQKLTLRKLESLYPQDKAIGYNINEIRGLWSITFDK
ncbi:DUF3365 domain-containing protein [Algibacter sp. L4_22]|uniref:c-type heme family protein n=1 Tax=Algibacter sp. L4_22 TaxID=2942477 RepID=UPI00201B49BF|nr:DUF3365 domain-containing protein [Algibacter sp. L4_22]MCL5128285.1 DUF3365 domain-containing protein [Algibacter sp. L4_22]